MSETRHRVRIARVATQHPTEGWAMGHQMVCACGRMRPVRLTRDQAETDRAAHSAATAPPEQPELPDMDALTLTA